MKRPPLFPVLIGTGFGSGFSPLAPGTAGALLASAVWMLLYYFVPFTTLFWITLSLVLVFTIAGVWAANKLEPYWGEDPSRVVVDEMVGVWIPLLAVPNTVCARCFYPISCFRYCQAFGCAQNGKPAGWSGCDDG